MSWIADHPLSILPELRIVTRNDFFDAKGHKTYPETFYIKCYHRGIIEEHRAMKGYNWSIWKQYTKDKQMFVKK